MQIRPWALVLPLLGHGCGAPASRCASAEQLAAVEIAFMRTYDDDGRHELRGASLDGLDVPLLCTDEPVDLRRLVGWSADGASLAILETVDREDWLTVIDLGESTLQRIANAQDARWSPVGRKIAFIASSDATRGELFVWDDGAVRSLGIDDTDILSWGPDGVELMTYVTHDLDGTRPVGLYRVELDGSSELVPDARHGEWSPDGRFITYSEVYLGTGTSAPLYVHELATGDKRPLASPGTKIPTSGPRWSIDGELVAVGLSELDCLQPICRAVGVFPLDGSEGSVVAGSTLDFAWSTRDTRIVVAEPTDAVEGTGPTRLQIRRGAGDEVVAPAADDDPWSDARPAWRP